MSGAGREPVPASTTFHPGEPRGPWPHLAGSADLPVSSFQSICLSLNIPVPTGPVCLVHQSMSFSPAA